MATAFAHDVPDTSSPLTSAAGKLALVASAGAAEIAAEAATDPSAPEPTDAQALNREFHALIDRIAAKPNSEDRFQALLRAWRRLGAAPTDDPADVKLLAAWADWKSASLSIEGVGVGDDFKTDKPYVERRLAAEQAIIQGTASTVAGVLVKLRFALDCVTSEWASEALYQGDDLTLMGRADELDADAILIIDTIGFLTQAADVSGSDLAHAIAEAKRLEADASAYAIDVADKARTSLARALEAAEAAVPHRTTASSYENAFGDRVFMSTERPTSIEVGRRFLDRNDCEDDKEFIATCRAGVALLDERNRLVADAKARVTIDHDVPMFEAEEKRRWDAVHRASDAIVTIRCASPAELLVKFDRLVEDDRLDDEDVKAALRADIERLALTVAALAPHASREITE